MDNNEKNILEFLDKIIQYINNEPVNDGEEKDKLIYDFLTKKEKHRYDIVFEKNEIFSRKEIRKYKDMIILNLCTDFYIEKDYLLCKNRPFLVNERSVFLELEIRRTPQKILTYFKDQRSELEIKIIINRALNFVKKDTLYMKRCINNIINRYKVFRTMLMNPLAHSRYFNIEIIKSEIIKADVYDLYKNMSGLYGMEDYLSKIGIEKGSYTYYEINESKETLYIRLKQKLFDYLLQLYIEKERVIDAIAYIIGNAYEKMKLSSDKKYQNIINYIEKEEYSVWHIICLFLEDDNFSTTILQQFIQNIKLSDNEIMEHRRNIESLGFTKVLKKYNKYYDIEKERYQKTDTK